MDINPTGGGAAAEAIVRRKCQSRSKVGWEHTPRLCNNHPPAAVIFPSGRTAMPWASFEEIPSLDLIRLGEDLLHVHPIYQKSQERPRQEDRLISSISDLISRGKSSPTGLSSADAIALAKIFRWVPPPHQIPPQPHLMPLVVRTYPNLVACSRTRGPDC